MLRCLLVLDTHVRALRPKGSWTQVELGVNCHHLSRVHISDLERGVREAGLYSLRKIEAFDTAMFPPASLGERESRQIVSKRKIKAKPPVPAIVKSQQANFLKNFGKKIQETALDSVKPEQYDSHPLEELPGIREGFQVSKHADVAARRPPT